MGKKGVKSDPVHLKPFHIQKGQVLNPEGARAHNSALKALRKTTLETYREVIELILQGDMKQLTAMSQSKTISALHVGIARAFHRAINAGDYTVIERIAERIIGKIPENININQTGNLDINSRVTHFDGAALKIAMAKLESDV